ncbi:transglycosylase SLT domain-containing protein [Neptunomonas sp.]|uniref:transglycosylase SLT domain-containing protein n=1 Tax=Neptunomonas sp. TaxID=1971898 RepID=UPI003568AFB4
MFKIKKLLTAAALVSASFSVVAHLSTAQANTPDQQLYLKAKKAFEQNDVALANKLTAELKNYPLAPYLHARQIKRDIAQLDDKSVSRFIKNNEATPFAKDAQTARLDNLLQQNKWQQFTQAYAEYPIKSNRYQCELANAQYQSGYTKEAFTSAKQLWQVGYSQNKACDPLFSVWIQSGQLTSSVADVRFWNAIHKKDFALAKYLERFLTTSAQKKEIELWWRIKEQPDLITDTTLLSANNTHHGIMAIYAIRQIARSDINKAADLWLRERSRLAFDQTTIDKTNEYFGMRYAKGFRDNADEMLAKLDPEFSYEKLTEWRIRLELVKQDWQAVLTLIEKLPEDLKKEGRWVYWKVSSQQRLNPGKQKADYADVAKERSFYGFLASELTNDPFYLNHRPSGITAADKEKISALPAVQRIKELLAFDYQYAARVEWNLLTKTLSENDQLVMAHIAYDWGWYDQAIRGAARIKAWDDLDIRFPNPHSSLFEELTSERGIYETWAIAVARQESAFHQQARSRVGARGLMQLMPATAKMTAKRYDVKYSGPSELFTPRTNIALGTAYLAEVLETFEGNRAYATAAYNAGPHRVKRWLQARGDLPLDAWIETIPFDETRNYVQNVLAFSVIYDVMASKSTSLFNKRESASLALNNGAKSSQQPTL